MNRDDRNRLCRAARAYDYAIRQADSLFEAVLEQMRDAEADKIDRLPWSLQDSHLAEELNDALDMLDTLLDETLAVIEMLDEILSTVETTSNFIATSSGGEAKTLDKRNAGFHALLPASLYSRLKAESFKIGASMNEIVCRALKKALEG